MGRSAKKNSINPRKMENIKMNINHSANITYIHEYIQSVLVLGVYNLCEVTIRRLMDR